MAVSFNALVQYGSRPRIHMHSFEASSCEQFEERLRAAMSADRGYEPGMGIRVLSGEEMYALLSPASYEQLCTGGDGSGAIDAQLSVSFLPSAQAAQRRKRVAVLGGSFDPITDGHLKCACEIIHANKADEVWLVPCGHRPDKPSLKTPVMDRLIMCHLAVNTSFGARFPIKVCDYDTRRDVFMATYDMRLMFMEHHPDIDFSFVIGTDLVSTIKSWTSPLVDDAGQRLWDECEFLVVQRPGYAVTEELPPNFKFVEPPAGDDMHIVSDELSSTEVRNRLQKRGSSGKLGASSKSAKEAKRRSVGGMVSLHAHHEASYGEAEQAAIERGEFSKVEGLVPSAVLAHIVRYGLYKPVEPTDLVSPAMGSSSPPPAQGADMPAAAI